MQRILAILWITGMAALPLAGCSGSGNANADEGGADVAADTPPIHVEQTLVLLDGGQPKEERNYRQMLAQCQGGAFPVTPLDADVAKKVGRTYRQVWYDGERMAEKRDTWGFTIADQASPCQFKPTHESMLSITTADAAIDIDLADKSGTRHASDGPIRTALGDDDDALRAKVAAQLGDKMPQKLGEDTDAGQRCIRWKSAVTGESCVWSEGRDWGFDSNAVGVLDNDDYVSDHIVLWSKPADGNGMQLTTQGMTVGRNFEDNVFAVPSGIAMQDDD